MELQLFCLFLQFYWLITLLFSLVLKTIRLILFYFVTPFALFVKPLSSVLINFMALEIVVCFCLFFCFLHSLVSF